MRARRSVGRGRVALLVLNLSLVALICVRYSGLGETTAAETIAALPPVSMNLEVPAPIADLPPIDQFGAIVDRPLFHASRRPLAVETETAAPVASLHGYVLKGTIIRPDARIAVLEQSGQSIYLRASEGDIVGGWRLEQVESDRAVFEFRGRSTVLEIAPFEPPPADAEENE